MINTNKDTARFSILLLFLFLTGCEYNSTTIDAVKNGDFSEGLESWDINKTDKGLNVVEVIPLDEGSNKVLHVKRTNSGTDGTYCGVFQRLDLPLQGISKLVLKARLRPVSHTLRGTGRYGGEAPIGIRLRVKDASFPKGLKLWDVGFYTHGDNPYSHMQLAEADKWLQFKKDITKEFPATATIYAIQIIGSGWDFEGYADEIHLYVTP